MSITIDAVYEAGMLKPLEPLRELKEHTRVRLAIEADGTASSQTSGNHDLSALLERIDGRRAEIFRRGGTQEESAALIREDRERELE